MADRTAQILDSINVATAKGLELGPLTNPVVRRSDGDIHYLDHVDTDTLRARYATHVGFDVDAIVPIEAVVGDDVPFDYVIASHVIEHVPDMISWLHGVRSVLVDGGVLSLAIPTIAAASMRCARRRWRPTSCTRISTTRRFHHRARSSITIPRP